MKLIFKAMAYAGLIYSASSFASDFSTCQDFFEARTPPTITYKPMQKNTVAICSLGQAVVVSALTKTPLFSAEHLTPERLALSAKLPRVVSFKEDTRLPESYRSTLADYSRSGFDRGHLSPNSDMQDSNMQSESFYLSNIVPQNADNNRHLWAYIEHSTREMAKDKGGAFVVTGVAFLGKSSSIGRGVVIPSHMYKAIYFPSTHEASAWVTPNQEGNEYHVISINELTKMVGVDPFPSLDEKTKSTLVEFRKPVKFRF